jgi:hypothetical protein
MATQKQPVAKKPGKKKKKLSRSWQNQLFLIFGILMGVVFLPTTFLLCVGMLPTPVAILADTSRQKTKVMAVGAMNLAGCAPFLIELWANGNNFDRAIDIVTDPKAIIVMYAAALIGYIINWAMTGIVSSLLFEKGKNRQTAILKRQEELIERWGREVTGQIPLDQHGFALAPLDSKTPADTSKQPKKAQ